MSKEPYISHDTLQQTVKDLRLSLIQCHILLGQLRDLLDMAEEDCLGQVLDNPDRQGWFIRDEAVNSISKLLPIPPTAEDVK